MTKEEFIEFVSELNQEARSQLKQQGNVIEPASGFQLIITGGMVEELKGPLENLVAFTNKIINVTMNYD